MRRDEILRDGSISAVMQASERKQADYDENSSDYLPLSMRSVTNARVTSKHGVGGESTKLLSSLAEKTFYK